MRTRGIPPGRCERECRRCCQSLLVLAAAVAVAATLHQATQPRGVEAATVEWVGEGWSPAEPTLNDDCVLKLAADAQMVVLQTPVKCGSVSVKGNTQMHLEAPLTFVSTLTIDSTALVQCVGGAIIFKPPTGGGGGGSRGITVAGTLLMDSARIATDDGTTLPLVVGDGAGFVIGSAQGQNGANQLLSVAVTTKGRAQIEWNRGPLLLDSSTITVDTDAVFLVRGPTAGFSDPKLTGSINNKGTIEFDGSQSTGGAAQNMGVPLVNSGLMKIINNCNLVILVGLTVSGQLQMDNTATLQLAGKMHEFTASSKTESAGAIVVRSGSANFAGSVETAELIVQSNLKVTGKLHASTLTLSSGQIECSGSAECSADELSWKSCVVTGGGELRVLKDAQLLDPLSSKMLSNAVLSLRGNGTMQADTSVLLQNGGRLQLASENGVFVTREGAALNAAGAASTSDGGETKPTASRPMGMSVGAGVKWVVYPPFSVSVPVKSDGVIELVGKSSGGSGRGSSGSSALTFRNSADLRSITERGGDATLRFSGITPSAAFSVTEELNLPNQSLDVENGVFTLGNSPSTASVGSVTVRNANLVLPSTLNADTVEIGSETSSATVSGPGSLQARAMAMRAGAVTVAELRTTNLTLTGSNAAKDLYSRSATLDGWSRFSGPGPVRFGSGVRMHVNPNAVLFVDKNADLLDMSKATTMPKGSGGSEEEGDESSSDAIINVAGALVFTDKSRVSVALRIGDAAALVIGESAQTGGGPVTLSGVVRCSETAQLSIRPESTLIAACPTTGEDDPTQCTYPVVRGSGALQLANGINLFALGVSVGALSVTGGRHQLLGRVVSESARLQEGSTELYNQWFTKKLSLTGGALSGFDILKSAIVVTDSGTISIASGTCTLRGVDVISDGALEWSKGDLLLSEEADLATSNKGVISIRTPSTVKLVAGDASGKLFNAGQLLVTSGALQSGVAVVNRGKFAIRDGSSVTALGAVTQDGSGAILTIEPQATLHKPDGYVVINSGTLDSLGTIEGSVQHGGTLHAQPLASGHETALIRGDLVLGPTAILKLVCRWDGLDCVSMNVTGAAFVDGSANISFAQSTSSGDGSRQRIGDKYSLIRSNSLLGRFGQFQVDGASSGFDGANSLGFDMKYVDGGVQMVVVPATEVTPRAPPTSLPSGLEATPTPVDPLIAETSPTARVPFASQQTGDPLDAAAGSSSPSPFSGTHTTGSGTGGTAAPQTLHVVSDAPAGVAKGKVFGMPATQAEVAFLVILAAFVGAVVALALSIVLPHKFNVCRSARTRIAAAADPNIAGAGAGNPQHLQAVPDAPATTPTTLTQTAAIGKGATASAGGGASSAGEIVGDRKSSNRDRDAVAMEVGRTPKGIDTKTAASTPRSRSTGSGSGKGKGGDSTSPRKHHISRKPTTQSTNI